jgi:autotransporter-associated beta strand protein/T5SS/PEP-CTERM-associated repeat protein
VLCLALVLGGAGPALRAATKTWVGGATNANWDSVSNWNGASLPASGDTVQFGTNFASGTTINLNGNRTANTLLISTTEALVLTNNTLTLSSGDITRYDVAGTELDHYIYSDIALGADGTWTINGSGSLIVNGVISGARKITKAGSGDLILGGANTYGNGLVLSAGTFGFASDAAAGTGTLTLGAVTVRAVSGARTLTNTVTISGNPTFTGSDLLSFTGTATLSADRTLTVDSGSTVRFEILTDGGGKHALTKAGDGELIIMGNGTLEGFVFNAGRLGVGAANSLGENKEVTFNGGDIYNANTTAVTIARTLIINSNFTISGAQDLTLSGAATLNGARTLTVINTGLSTLSGVLSGTGSLTKEGDGVLYLSGANSYSGGTTLNAGTVRIDNNASFGSTNVAVTLNAATINVITTFTTIRPFTLGSAASTFDINASRTNTLNGILSGSGGLVKTGAGTLTLGGTTNNSFTNLTIVQAGLLQLNKTAGLNAIGGSLTVGDGSGGAGADIARLLTSNQIPDTATVTVLNSGLFDLNGFNETIAALSLTGGSVTSGSGTLVLGGNVTGNADPTTATITGNLSLGGATRTFTIADGSPDTDLSITAVVSNGAVTKDGAGTLALFGTNTYTGNTIINAGVLAINSTNSLGATNGSVTINSGTLHAATNIATVRSIILGAADSTVSVASGSTYSVNTPISGTGALTKTGAGTLTLTAANTFTGAVTVAAGTLQLARATTNNTALLTDGVAGNTDITISGGTLQIAASEQIANNAGIVLNTGAFNFSGSGLTETIGTFRNNGGTFTSGANTLVGAGSSITWAGGTNIISADGTVQDAHWLITGGTNTVQGQGGGTTGGTLHVLSGGAGLEFGGTNSPTITLDSDAGTAGRILLESDVTVLGTLSNGTAQILNGGAAANPGFIDMNGATRTFTVNDGSAATDLLIGVRIQNGGLIKAGAGTLTLNASNTYTGSTFVNAGALETADGAALTGTTNLLVQTGGVLWNSSANTYGAGFFDGSNSLRVATVTGTGSLWTNSGALWVGNLGTNNRLIVTNGGVIVSGGGGLGNASSSSNNTALVTGSGSVWSNIGTFYVGISGPGNTLTITNGGLVTASGSSHIGFISSASNNSALVTGSGSLWTMTNDLFIGNAAAGNRLVISNGAQVANRVAQIGASIGASNNLVVVTGTNTLWINRSNLFVGGAGIGNQLIITNAASVTVGGSLIVGSTTNSSGNLATLGHGTLTVTNSAGAASLDVRRGTFVFNGGTLTADALLLTNGAGGTFTFNDGTLTTRATQVTNGSAFVVGNGTASAVFNLAGTNWHSFNNGLTINTNARAILSNGNLTSGASVTVVAGGALELTGGITVNATALTLNGAGISSGGALRNTSGNNTYAGNVTLGSAATVVADTGSMTLSGTVDNGGHTLTVAGAGNTTISGAVSGAGGLTKTGAGTATLSGDNTFTGTLRVNQGTLQLGASDRIANSANMELNGGTFHTGGFNETLGTMTLGASSIIDFGSGASTLTFADSSALTWTGTLEIHNWSGDAYGGGTDRLIFGNAATGLTADQLARIVWKNPFGMGDVTASVIYANGEVVPVPEPGTVAAVVGLVALVAWRERRRLSAFFVRLGFPGMDHARK